ncbi:RDD family protein [Candidatus Halobeggiatoa sp. HSG11]|nr:RDD family protein [Candidatus Halobeggiatoa sp. HSG11]
MKQTQIYALLSDEEKNKLIQQLWEENQRLEAKIETLTKEVSYNIEKSNISISKNQSNLAQCPSKEPLVEGEYGGFWLRSFALTIDVFILFISIMIIIYISYISYVSYVSIGNIEGLKNIIDEYLINIISSDGNTFFSLYVFFLCWLYFTILESSCWQTTIGKYVMGLIVTDTYGNRISFLRANIRYWLKILSIPIFPISVAMIRFIEKRQALHDFIAGTVVAKLY